jgi:hypothetical protein
MNLWPLIVGLVLIGAVGLYFVFTLMLGSDARRMERIVNERAEQALGPAGEVE